MLGMILGLFGKPKGTIEIKLERVNFKPGETIKGFVALQLNENAKARELCVVFLGQEVRDTQQGMVVQTGSRTNASNMRTLIDFKQTLSGEKEYAPTPAPQTFPFEIAIPADILPNQTQSPPIGGAIGDALKFGQMLGALPSTQTTYHFTLTAKLDIPWSGDVSKTMQINVTR